jgi:hypothetical protein
MDEGIDLRRIAAGCVAVIALLSAGAALGRCSLPAAAEQLTAPTLDVAITIGNDNTIEAQAAIAETFRNVGTSTTAAPQSVSAVSHSGDDRWDRLAQCEAGGNWAANTGNGFGGGLQFMHQRSYSTWLSFGGGDYADHPWDASREQQIVVAEKVLARSGWNAWPGCSRKNGWI